MNPTTFEYSESFALEMDAKDSMAHFRSRFHFPKVNGQEAIYFCGNSLGLQPKSVKDHLEKMLGIMCGKSQNLLWPKSSVPTNMKW